MKAGSEASRSMNPSKPSRNCACSKRLPPNQPKTASPVSSCSRRAVRASQSSSSSRMAGGCQASRASRSASRSGKSAGTKEPLPGLSTLVRVPPSYSSQVPSSRTRGRKPSGKSASPELRPSLPRGSGCRRHPPSSRAPGAASSRGSGATSSPQRASRAGSTSASIRIAWVTRSGAAPRPRCSFRRRQATALIPVTMEPPRSSGSLSGRRPAAGLVAAWIRSREVITRPV